MRDEEASKLKKNGAKKGAEASQAGCEVRIPYRKAIVMFLGPILVNLGPHLAFNLRQINAVGMRGAPGDSRIELSALLNHIWHGRPRGGGRFQRSAHSAGPVFVIASYIF